MIIRNFTVTYNIDKLKECFLRERIREKRVFD